MPSSQRPVAAQSDTNFIKSFLAEKFAKLIIIYAKQIETDNQRNAVPCIETIAYDTAKRELWDTMICT